MKFISIKTLSLFDLVILLYPILSFISEGMIYSSIQVKEMNFLLFTIIIMLSLFIGGFPQIIFNIYLNYKRNTKHKVNIVNSQKSFEAIKLIPDYKKRNLTIIVIIGMAITNIFIRHYRTIVFYLLGEIGEIDFFYYVFLISSLLILSKFITKTDFYIQHYISLGIFALGYIEFNYNVLLNTENYAIALYDLGFSIVLGFITVMCKLIMERKYIQPLSFCFFYGLTGLILIGITCLICYYFNLQHEYINDIWNIPFSLSELFSTWRNAVFILLYLITQSIVNPMKYLVMYHENPITEIMLYIIGEYFLYFYLFITTWDPSYLEIMVILSTSFVIVLISSLIFIEYLIIHLCKMNRNTKEEIAKRAMDDMHLMTEFRLSILAQENNNS